MAKLIDRWFWRGLAVLVAGALWVIALRAPWELTPSAQAGMKPEEQQESYDLSRKEYAQLLLNSHPYIRILTPHLTSEYLVMDNSVLHLITYDKKLWDEIKIKKILDVRHRNAVTTMKALGFKGFELGDLQEKFEPY